MPHADYIQPDRCLIGPYPATDGVGTANAAALLEEAPR